MESTAYPLNMTLKEEEEEEEIQSRDLEDGHSDMQKVRICSEGGWVPALFDEVAIYFSDEEWEVLTEQQKALYREVMRMNYETVLSLEFPFPKPDMITRLEGEEESQKSNEWQLQGGPFPAKETVIAMTGEERPLEDCWQSECRGRSRKRPQCSQQAESGWQPVLTTWATQPSHTHVRHHLRLGHSLIRDTIGEETTAAPFLGLEVTLCAHQKEPVNRSEHRHFLEKRPSVQHQQGTHPHHGSTGVVCAENLKPVFYPAFENASKSRACVHTG